VAALFMVCSWSTCPAATIKVDPKQTFLRTNSDSALASVPIVIADIGFKPGDWVLVKRLGDFKAGTAYSDVSTSMIALFSGSATLLASANLHRVPDAIDAGADHVTPKTYHGDLDTDVPEDFLVSDGAIVRIPPAATHLFVCPPDSLFYDNTDPDNDYAVSITRASTDEFAASALAVWSGLIYPSPTTALSMDAVPSPAPPPVVNLLDAVRLARRASGLDP
jgi:hypothetical protein